jgi:hypothetical protein
MRERVTTSTGASLPTGEGSTVTASPGAVIVHGVVRGFRFAVAISRVLLEERYGGLQGKWLSLLHFPSGSLYPQARPEPAER